jgi:GntR family transcriptional regulator
MIIAKKKCLTSKNGCVIFVMRLVTLLTNQKALYKGGRILIKNFTDSQPIFIQIAEMLKDAILSDAYPEESQIPSITEFAVAYKINPATALKGVNMLVDEGLLYKKRGLGMFVKSGAKARLAVRRKENFYLDYILPLLEEAVRLKIRQQELQDMIERGYSDYGN